MKRKLVSNLFPAALLAALCAPLGAAQRARGDSPLGARRKELMARAIPPDLDLARRREGPSFVASYRADTQGDRVPLSRLHDWVFEVRTKAGAPYEGNVTVAGDMPLHLHGLPSEPKVERLGRGRYRVRGLRFHMPGWWTVSVILAGGAGGRLEKGTAPTAEVRGAVGGSMEPETLTFNLMLP